tara:strand:+ start:172 stop:939 length:768 start_codon:yes stop_codon:yes gene_type:complete
MGNSRGSSVAWDSLQKNVLSVLDADLALVFGKGENENSLYKSAKYIKLIDEFDDWGKCIDYIATKENMQNNEWRSALLRGNLDTALWGGIKHNGKSLSGSGAIIFCFRYFVKELIKEHGLLDIYDQFIITRSDHYYAYEHARLDVNNVWIPHGEDYGGITDRHIVINKDNVLASLDIIPWCLKKNCIQGGNCEGVLKRFYEDIGLLTSVKRFDRTFFTVKTETDQNRWGRGHSVYLKELGVYTKYHNEYNQTMNR